MKKVILVSLVNLMAFSALFGLIRDEVGNAFAIKVFIPVTIIFATNLATVLTVIGKK